MAQIQISKDPFEQPLLSFACPSLTGDITLGRPEPENKNNSFYEGKEMRTGNIHLILVQGGRL